MIGLITVLYLAAPAPCVTATPDCTEWIVVAAVGPARWYTETSRSTGATRP
jgi:hypothetical protein